MDFELEPSNERFEPLDDRWLDQVGTLMADLRREAGPVDRRSVPPAGQKGGLGPIILALGSAGAFTAAVEVIKAFVGRDQSRAVRLSWHHSGQLESFEVSGHGIDDAIMERVIDVFEHPPERVE